MICLCPHLRARSELGIEPMSMCLSVLYMDHTVALGYQGQFRQELQADQLGEGGHWTWVVSLCLSTHLSEEVGRPGQWFSDLATYQGHLQSGQKQVLGPLPYLLIGLQRVGPRNLHF